MKNKPIDNAYNNQPVSDFLGLTPEHLHAIINTPLDKIQHIVNFEPSFDPDLLKDVSVVQKASLLIKLIGDEGSAKSTKKGYLPKKIVNALYDFHELDKFTVATEEYAPSILALRQAITECGWLKKRSGYFSLTKKGEQIYQEGFLPSHYVLLLKFWISNYNWGFTDGYPACSIIQQSAVFSLYMLLKRAQEPLSAEDFAELFIRAFPYALKEIAAEAVQSHISPEEELSSILRLRFLERFAVYFGLIDYLADDKLPYFERCRKAQIKTTRLFKEVLNWFPPDKQRGPAAVPDIGNDLLH